MVIKFPQKKRSFDKSHLLFLRTLLLFCFLLFFNTLSFAQSYPFRHFTVTDGLISTETYHVFQDSKGYIWTATNNGVSRYDGYEFKNFTKEDGLPDNTVFEIYEDYKNRIWFVPHSINLSYFYNDSIYHYEFNDSIQNILKGNGNPIKLSFFIDNTDNIYFSDNKTGTYKLDSNGIITKVEKSSKGFNFFLLGEKLIYQNSWSESDTIPNTYMYNIYEKNELIFSKSIRSIDRKNTVLIGKYYSIKNGPNIFMVQNKTIIQIKDNVFKHIRHLAEVIIWISIDKNNNLWLGTYDGVLCYKNSDLDKKPLIFLLGKDVSSVLDDNEGGYWFSTLHNGLFYLPNINTKTFTSDDGLPAKNISSIVSDNKSLWLGFHDNFIVRFESNRIR